jgi:hippurate hydrolase
LGVPYTYWFIGGIDADRYQKARRPAGWPRTSRPTTPPSSPPVIQPVLDIGTKGFVVATLA